MYFDWFGYNEVFFCLFLIEVWLSDCKFLKTDTFRVLLVCFYLCLEQAVVIHTHTRFEDKGHPSQPNSLITLYGFNPLNAELNPICHLLTLVGAHHIVHFSSIRVNVTTFGSYSQSHLQADRIRKKNYYVNCVVLLHFIYISVEVK